MIVPSLPAQRCLLSETPLTPCAPGIRTDGFAPSLSSASPRKCAWVARIRSFRVTLVVARKITLETLISSGLLPSSGDESAECPLWGAETAHLPEVQARARGLSKVYGLWVGRGTARGRLSPNHWPRRDWALGVNEAWLSAGAAPVLPLEKGRKAPQPRRGTAHSPQQWTLQVMGTSMPRGHPEPQGLKHRVSWAFVDGTA